MSFLRASLEDLSLIGGRHQLPLAVAGFTLVALGFAADDLLRRPPPGASEGDPGIAILTPLRVENPAGRSIGALSVEYPRSMRENEDGAIRLRYAPQGAGAGSPWLAAAAKWPDLQLSVELVSARLSLHPAPPHYTFDRERIAAGGDERQWILSPEREGDYTVLVRLVVEPPGFKTVRLSANGAPLAGGRDVSLPVTVYTRYWVPQSWISIVQSVGAVLGFLISLPIAAKLLTLFLRSREPSPAVGGRDAPAPPSPPTPQDSPSGPRRGRVRRPPR